MVLFVRFGHRRHTHMLIKNATEKWKIIIRHFSNAKGNADKNKHIYHVNYVFKSWNEWIVRLAEMRTALSLSFCVCYVHVNNRRKYIWIYCRWTSFFRHAHFWSARLVGNWIAHLTQNKCVNGFSSKIKQNVIKMMSLHAVIHQTFRLPPAHLALAQIFGIFFFPVIAFFLILHHKFYSANSRFPQTFYTWGNSMKCCSTEFLVLNIKWIECEFNISAHAAKWRLRFMQIA